MTKNFVQGIVYASMEFEIYIITDAKLLGKVSAIVNLMLCNISSVR